MSGWRRVLAVSAVGLALTAILSGEGVFVREESLVSRRIIRYPDKTYVVEECSKPLVPGQDNRGYDLIGVYSPEISDSEIGVLRRESCLIK